MNITMNLKDQQDSAAALRSQLAAGISVAEAVECLAELQPDHSEFWLAAASQISNGAKLSKVLAGRWPPTAISAVYAGEESSKIVPVLANLVSSIEIQRDIRKELIKIVYPAGILIAGFGMFVGIMLTLVPHVSLQIQRARGNYGPLEGIAGFGLSARELLMGHWMLVSVVLVASVAAIVSWARKPSTMDSAIRLVADTPLLGSALRKLSFGLWARYLAMASAAGLPTVDAMRATTSVLPGPLQDGVRNLVHDLAVKNMALDRATNARSLPQDDPRTKWPLYIRQAFALGQRNGDLHVELERVAPELIRSGKDDMDRFTKAAYAVAIAISGAMVAGSMFLVYVPMISGLQGIK